jgi:hypothetical protein
VANLHGGVIGGKCRLAKVTIASGFGMQIDGGYGAYRHSVFLKGLRVRFSLLTDQFTGGTTWARANTSKRAVT